MHRVLLAFALSAAAVPALAMGPEAMSCADFTSLDDAGRMAAMAPAEGGMMASGDAGGMMASDDAGGMMAADHGTAVAAAACAAHPEMTVGAAMAAGG
jgi:hypothetical protein